MIVGQHALVHRDKGGGLEMRRGEDAAIAAMRQHRVIIIVLAGHHREPRRAAAQQLDRLHEIAR